MGALPPPEGDGLETGAAPAALRVSAATKAEKAPNVFMAVTR